MLVDRLMYFGLDKNKDNGNNNVGFWFLQGSANCASIGPRRHMERQHTRTATSSSSPNSRAAAASAAISAYQWAGGRRWLHRLRRRRDRCDRLSVRQVATARQPPAPVTTICATTNSGANAWNDQL